MWFISIIFAQLLVTQLYGMDPQWMEMRSGSPRSLQQKIIEYPTTPRHSYNNMSNDDQKTNEQEVLIKKWKQILAEKNNWAERKRAGKDAIEVADIHPDQLIYDAKNLIIEAICKKDHIFLKYLLEHRANPNSCDQNGKPALFYAKDLQSVQILLAHGANVNIVCKDGRNALFYLPHNTYNECINSFINYGIKLDHQDNHKLTALTFLSLQPDGTSDSIYIQHKIQRLVALGVPYQQCKDERTRKLFECRNNYGAICPTLEQYVVKKINKKTKEQRKRSGQPVEPDCCSVQ